jgi:hypothetical protein
MEAGAMKARSGFVSNSSSSSFVIKAGRKVTVKSVAGLMLDVREADGWPPDDDAMAKLRALGDDEPACFRSCNYDTFLVRAGDFILVSTCHNHPFKDELPDVLMETGPPTPEGVLQDVVRAISSVPKAGQAAREWKKVEANPDAYDVLAWIEAWTRDVAEFTELEPLPDEG